MVNLKILYKLKNKEGEISLRGKNMKITSSAIVKMVVVTPAVFSLIITSNAGYVSTPLNTEKTPQGKNAPTDFYANITIHVYEGEGCGFISLRGISINATGRNTDHYTSGVTDEKGLRVFQLGFDKIYWVSIHDANHESVLFDFFAIDDQAFSFHMKVIQRSSQAGSFL
jgi:hypothetical protein